MIGQPNRLIEFTRDQQPPYTRHSSSRSRIKGLANYWLPRWSLGCDGVPSFHSPFEMTGSPRRQRDRHRFARLVPRLIITGSAATFPLINGHPSFPITFIRNSCLRRDLRENRSPFQVKLLGTAHGAIVPSKFYLKRAPKYSERKT